MTEEINSYLKQLEENDEIDFSENDIEEIKNALENTFEIKITLNQEQALIKQEVKEIVR